MPFKLSLQVCAAEFESREYYLVSTCMTELFKVKVYSLHVEVSKAEYVQQFLCCLLLHAILLVYTAGMALSTVI